jgi:hypothetical protein
MTDQNPAITLRQLEKQRRRLEYEETAADLGQKRSAAKAQVVENTQAIIDLIRPAMEAGVPRDTLSKLLGVSRQTLYAWEEAGRPDP